MPDPNERSPYRYVAWVSGLGLIMVLCIVVGLGIGRFLDHILRTFPWCSLVCSILGMLAGGWSIYKGILLELKKDSGDKGES